MKSKFIDINPALKLLDRHYVHKKEYIQDFIGLKLKIFPNVFNPAFTNVSNLLGNYLTSHISASYTAVLDMFCGSGALGFLIAHKAKRLVGIDLSETAIACAKNNAKFLGFSHIADYRYADLWNGVKPSEKFNLIIANPPLLPAVPENLLEKAVADSPTLETTINFIKGSSQHLLDKGEVLMAFSNASKVIFSNPIEHIRYVAKKNGLRMKVVAKRDVGYEIYRIIKFIRR